MELFHKRGAKFRTHYSAYVGLIVGRIIDSVNGWQNVVGELGQKKRLAFAAHYFAYKTVYRPGWLTSRLDLLEAFISDFMRCYRHQRSPLAFALYASCSRPIKPIVLRASMPPGQIGPKPMGRPGHKAPGHQALSQLARWPLPRINWPIKASKGPDGLPAIGACLRPLCASVCGSMGIGWTDLKAQLMTHGRFESTNFAKFGSHSPDHATAMHRRIIRQPPLRSYLTI
jgi:hypothetical protein